MVTCHSVWRDAGLSRSVVACAAAVMTASPPGTQVLIKPDAKQPGVTFTPSMIMLDSVLLGGLQPQVNITLGRCPLASLPPPAHGICSKGMWRRLFVHMSLLARQTQVPDTMTAQTCGPGTVLCACGGLAP